MKKEKLKPNQTLFGNKGDLWNGTAHIFESGIGNLCGTPALSTNHCKDERKAGCPKCIEIFNAKSNE